MSTTNDSRKNWLEPFAGIALIAASVLICIMGISQIREANKITGTSIALLKEYRDKTNAASTVNLNAMKDGYNQALIYFALAIGALAVAGILPRLLSFSITPTGITGTLKQLEQDVAEIKQHSASTQAQLGRMRDEMALQSQAMAKQQI